jgi:Spy/CpxP family protein refolding chaperone
MTNPESPTTRPALPAPLPRRRWVTVLAAVLIFCAGLASGVGLTVVVAVHRLQHAIHHPEEAPERVAKLLQHRLKLDDKQTSQIEAIVAKRQVELTAIRQKFHPQIAEQLDELHKEIGEVLTAPQRERWATMFSEFRERWLPPAPPAAQDAK